MKDWKKFGYVAVAILIGGIAAWFFRSMDRSDEKDKAMAPSTAAPPVTKGNSGGTATPSKEDATAASKEKLAKAPGRKFDEKDFGKLPALPEGYSGDDKFIPLVGRMGQRPLARISTATEIRVGNGACPLQAGTTVGLIAQRGSLYLLNVWPPCQTETHRIREGYVPVADAQLLPPLSRH